VLQEDKSGKDYELKKVRELVDRCGVALTLSEPSSFSIKNIEPDLEKLVQAEIAATILPYIEQKVAMSAASALIQYLDLDKKHCYGTYYLYQHDLSQFMKLDASAVRALNLMPGPRDGSKNMSLYGLLNKCKTSSGTRLLGQWLKQPLMSLEEIEKRHSLVESFVEDTDLRQTMQEEHLKKIPDLSRLSKRFQRKIANLEDVVRAYQVAITLPGFIGTLDAVMDEKYKDPLDQQYTDKLREIAANLEQFQALVETTVDLDAIDNHEFLIKPEHSQELQSFKEQIDDLKYEMQKEHRRASSDLGQEMDKKLFLETHKVYGWCFRLTRNEAGSIRNRKDYKEMTTQKNGVYFTTTTLSDLNREVDQATQKYDAAQTNLVKDVVEVAGELGYDSTTAPYLTLCRVVLSCFGGTCWCPCSSRCHRQVLHYTIGIPCAIAYI